METSYKKLLALFMVCIIASCGFHLRGMTNVSFKKISLEGQKIRLMEDLRKILIDNKVEIVTNKENPELTIEFISENSEKRILSLSGQGTVKEYEIFYRIRYRTKMLKNEKWSDEYIIETRRDFSYSDSNLIGKQTEEQQLNDAMRNEAIANLFNQIQAVNK